MPKLLLGFQGAVIKEISLNKDEMTIGRSPDNDIVIDNPAVSGHHCKITKSADTFFVEDLNSSNGVFVNAKKTLKAGLKHSDVIGIVKHTLKFVDEGVKDATLPPSAPAPSADATMMLAPEKQKEIAVVAATATQKPAVIRVIKGVVNELEHELKAQSTYIGKSDKAQIRIKGTGFFGSAPESACMISRKMDGYFIVPVKENYAKLNGKVITQREKLNDGDVIEAGGTTLQFEQETAPSA